MGHVIDHEDLTTRVWVCTTCGCTCLSKNPWRRNTHGEGPGGMLGAMYLGALRNQSTVKLVKAQPPRPKEEVYVSYDGRGEFCYIGREQDIALFIDPGNGRIDDTRQGKPLETPAQRLLEFFKLIRGADESVLKAYVCAELGGGHEWTDDPAEIAKHKKDDEDAREA